MWGVTIQYNKTIIWLRDADNNIAKYDTEEKALEAAQELMTSGRFPRGTVCSAKKIQ